ncbi:uncharacterized protein [Nerophis lumbriciformis]|nr:uncharacterized protein LOC133621567 isoform X2 [Nerophis lumbriciformis]
MKTHCEGLRPPCVLSSKSRPQPPSEGREQGSVSSRGPPGYVHNRGANVGKEGSHPFPFLPHISAATRSSTVLPPSQHKTLRSIAARPQGKECKGSGIPSHVPEDHGCQQVEVPTGVSAAGAGGPHWGFSLSPAGCKSSKASHGSLSDFSRPPSSLLSPPSSSLLNRPSSSLLSRPSSSLLNRPSSSLLSRPSSSLLSRPSSSLLSRPSSSLLNRPSSSLLSQPSSSLLNRPSSILLNRPSSSLQNQPSSSLQNRPSSSLFNRPSSSQFSRPSSSLFSRSTDLASCRGSVLSEHIRDFDPLDSLSHRRQVLQSSSGHGSTPEDDRTRFGPLRAASNLVGPLNTLEDACDVTKVKERHRGDGMDFPHRPSATWSAPRATPYVLAGHSESGPRPVLAPISAMKANISGLDSWASLDSAKLSCSRSQAFDELDAIAPSSASCSSLERGYDSSGRPSPRHELLSPSLAALTVGCDSGNLGSLSRVQLLLLDRMGPVTLQCPMEDYLLDQASPVDDLLTPSGPRGPLTAGHLPERCDSAWKVPGDNKLDWSAGASRCPSSGAMRKSLSQDSPPSSDIDHDSDSGREASGRKNPDENFPEKKDWRPEERKNKVLKMLYKLQDHSVRRPKVCSDFDDFDFLAKFCIFSAEKLEDYKKAFQAEDTDEDGYISCIQVVDALKSIVPAELLSDQEEVYVYRILALVDFRVTDGLVDLRLFAVIASLAQKIAAMDDFMRSLVTNMDLRSLEVRLFKVKQLFLFLLEGRRGEVGSLRGVISAEQFLLELKAGGIHLEEEEVAIRQKLQNLPPLDLLDFLAYLPLFMLIHKSVVANPLDDSGPV